MSSVSMVPKSLKAGDIIPYSTSRRYLLISAEGGEVEIKFDDITDTLKIPADQGWAPHVAPINKITIVSGTPVAVWG